jgi:predicted nucleic acid-binding protein
MSISSAILSRRVFVDTSAYYALTDQHDSRHGQAFTFDRHFAQYGFRVVD